MAGYWYALSKEGAETSKENCPSRLLSEHSKMGSLSKEEIGGLTSSFIGGGVDTTTSTMLSFILACIAFADAIKPAARKLIGLFTRIPLRPGKTRTTFRIAEQ